jgi:hypothetical protein
LTLVLGAVQWLWALLVVLSVWNQIIYHSSFAIDGYYWWVDAASYAVLLGAIVFTIMGFIAVRTTKLTS